MNYLKLREIKKLYFPYQELSNVLGITSRSAKVSASRYVKTGYLVRFKRNFYILKERWDALDKEGKFILANLIEVPSYISLMTALGYHEITTQIQRDFVESVSIYRTKEAEIETSAFSYTRINKKLYFSFEKKNGFFIATPEKAFLDALYLMSLNRYSFDMTSIDFDKLDKSKMGKMLRAFPDKTQTFFKSLAAGG